MRVAEITIFEGWHFHPNFYIFENVVKGRSQGAVQNGFQEMQRSLWIQIHCRSRRRRNGGKIAQHDESIAKTMFKAGKITQDDAISFFNIPEDVAHSWKR